MISLEFQKYIRLFIDLILGIFFQGIICMEFAKDGKIQLPTIEKTIICHSDCKQRLLSNYHRCDNNNPSLTVKMPLPTPVSCFRPIIYSCTIYTGAVFYSPIAKTIICRFFVAEKHINARQKDRGPVQVMLGSHEGNAYSKNMRFHRSCPTLSNALRPLPDFKK